MGVSCVRNDGQDHDADGENGRRNPELNIGENGTRFHGHQHILTSAVPVQIKPAEEIQGMCDYSLMNFPNRLAREGEELVVHRFPSGSLGLASPSDVEAWLEAAGRRSFWQRLKDVLVPVRTCSAPAVCIPPSAHLAVHGIDAAMQKEFAVSAEEEVRFEQLNAHVNAYRDAIVFANGKKVRLQELPVGLHMRVIDLGGSEEPEDRFAYDDLLKEREGEPAGYRRN